MCLSKIDVHYSKDDETEGIGYKVIFGDRNYFYTPIFGGFFYYDKWYNRTIANIVVLNQGIDEIHEYESGFHIFLNKDDCIKYCQYYSWPKNFCATSFKRHFITKVHYKGIVCKGLQNNFPCIVAKSIMIKEEDILDKETNILDKETDILDKEN